MRRVSMAFGTVLVVLSLGVANAQDHVHGPASGLAHGVPDFCAGATVS